MNVRKIALTSITMFLIVLMVMLGYNMAIGVNVKPSSPTNTLTPATTPTKVYYHDDNISKGYYHGEGFKLVNNEWVLAKKEGIVYLVFRPIKPSKPQNYVLLLYCLPLREFKENPEAVDKFDIIEYKFTRGLLRNDSKLVLEALNELEKSFPLELKASIVAGGKEVGVYHKIAYSAKEKMAVPIKIKAPLGKLSKEYVVIVEIIKSFSEKELGGSRFYVYIKPPS